MSLFQITFSLCQYFSSISRAYHVRGRSCYCFTVQSNTDKFTSEMPHFSKPQDWSPLLCKTQVQLMYEQQNVFCFCLMALHSWNQYQINNRTILCPNSLWHPLFISHKLWSDSWNGSSSKLWICIQDFILTWFLVLFPAVWSDGSVRAGGYHCLPWWIRNCSFLWHHHVVVLGKKLSMIAG